VVQPNQPNTDCPTSGAAAIAGAAHTETNLPVEAVNMQLSGNMDSDRMTTTDGQYIFSGVELAYDYTVTPHKDDDALNGVTTFDLVLISKHILNVDPLDSPYQLIAADANNSGSVSTFDLVQIRKLILLIDENYPNNTSWRFVDADYEFPSPQNPWQEAFPEIININDLPDSRMDADFVGIKIGDVNGSVQPNSLFGIEGRSKHGMLSFRVEDRMLEAGSTYSIPVIAPSGMEAIEGYQYTLQVEETLASLKDVQPVALTPAHFGTAFAESGHLTTSWNSHEPLAAGQELYRLLVQPKVDVRLSELLTVTSRYTPAEGYHEDGRLLDIGLDFGHGSVKGQPFELYQNQPNPFSDQTQIRFYLPEAAEATLTIQDATGKLLREIQGEYGAGMQQIELDLSKLPGVGVLYYTLKTEQHTATRKMIKVQR